MVRLAGYTDPVLREKAKPVDRIDEKIHRLISEMVVVMKNSGGIGIAAPQVGHSLQLAVIEIPEEKSGRVVLINPRILSAYGSETAEEGCLSVPGARVKVKRCKDVVVETTDISGKIVTYKVSGLFARAMQHEIDHLNGTLIVDKVCFIKKLAINAKIRRVSHER